MNLEKLYKTNKNRYVTRIKRHFKNSSDAEDVVQEAMLRALKYADKYDPNRSSLNTWMNHILRSVERDFKKKPDMVDGETDVNGMPDAEIFLKSLEHQFIIDREINKITNSSTKRVLQLYFIYGYTSKEISSMIKDVSQTQVTTLTSRFRGKLIKELG